METTQTLNPSATDGYLAVGTLLHGGRYRIERYLASGGFGKTYVAYDTAFQKTVVIKEFFLKDHCVRNADNTVCVSQSNNAPLFNAQRDKFHKEARRLHDLEHPNIVRVYDLFAENGTSYYTMTYIEGESFDDLLKHSGALPEAQIWPILGQLLDALAYVHKRHIWHLDIKPSNVLIDAEGHVCLIDFGASKMVDNDTSGTMFTSTSVTFTPGFAPLEQVAHDFSHFGPWTDFYALGATIYSLVSTQRVPTTSEIVAEGFGAFAFPSQTSKKLRNLVIWMMKPSRKARPQSVAALQDKIGTGKSPARPQTQEPLKPVSFSRNWWKWAVVAVFVVAVGLSIWTYITKGEETAQYGSCNGHEYVDLGLPSGTLWATCNVGASAPEEYGDNFAWGETQPKSTYNWSAYFDSVNGSSSNFKKYYNSGGKNELDIEDDAAHMNWGEGWRVPSIDQIQELINNKYTTITWVTQNGKNGRLITSKINGATLFLPAAGRRYEGSLYSAGSNGYYWSRSLSTSYSNNAYSLGFDSSSIDWHRSNRYGGRFVRPVRMSASE